MPALAQDTLAGRALPQLAVQASKFWQSAPDYIARETLRQKAVTVAKRKLHVGASAAEPPKAMMRDREVVSYYALSSFRASPEALHEFRQVVSVDGKPVSVESGAREKLRATLASNDDRAKKTLAAEFEKAGLAVAATDFGQLVLLFTKPNQRKYRFESHSTGLVGADRAIVISFHQIAGNESVKIVEPGKAVREPLSGDLWVRESDFLPLRITLNVVRRQQQQEIRDEARVDYEPKANATILPAAVVYRRYVNDELQVENIYEYSDWQPVNAK